MPDLPETLFNAGDSATNPQAFRIRLYDRAVSVLAAIAAWCLLRLWAYPAPYPGEPARIVAAIAGIARAPSAGAPLWTLLARALCGGEAPDAVFAALQMLAQLLVALAVGLFHGAALRLLLGHQTEDTDARWTPWLCRAGALSATALLLAFPPVWHAAQSPSPDALGLFLAALAMRLAVATVVGDDFPPVPFLALCAVLGAGAVESPVTQALLPFVILFLLTVNLGVERMGFQSELLQSPDAPPPDAFPPEGMPPRERAAPRFGAIVPLGFLVGALAFGVCLLLAIGPGGTGAPSLAERMAAAAKGVFGPLAKAASEPTARVPVILFALPAIAALTTARRLLSGEGGFVETVTCLLLCAMALLQTSRTGNLATWPLVSSTALQCTLALLAATVFAICAAAIPASGARLWRQRHAPRAVNGREDDWDDPFRAPPRRYEIAAVTCHVLGGLCLLLPLPLLRFDRESGTREAIATLSGYGRAIAHDVAPCCLLLSDVVVDTAVKLADPRILPIPPLADNRADEMQSTLDTTANTTLGVYEESLLRRLGWRALFNDWIAFAPSNIALVAAQTGRESWLDLRRHNRPDLTPVRRGLVVRPASAPAPQDGFSDADEWRARLDALRSADDPWLAQLARDAVTTLDGLDDLLRSDTLPKELPPFEFLGPLADEAGREEALSANPSNLAAALCRLVATAAVSATEEETARGFDALREGASHGASRLCDLVQAMLDLRLYHEPERALHRLERHEYDEVLDPSFWYIWGVCGQAIGNDYNIMRANEVLEKFPDRRILEYQLAASIARAKGDSDAEIAALRSCIGTQPGDLFQLRRVLVVQCLARPEDLDAASGHAERLLRRDAEFPLAHIVYAAKRLLHPDDAGGFVERDPFRAVAAHIARARRFLPPPHERLDAMLGSLAEGVDPGLSAEGARALVLDVARFCAVPDRVERLLYETALLIQHHDAEAQNSRYLVDPLIEIERREEEGIARDPL